MKAVGILCKNGAILFFLLLITNIQILANNIIEGNSITIDDIVYHLNDELGEAIVETGTYSSKEDLVIPKDIVSASGKKYIVTGIGERCFGNCKLKNITLPSTIREIGKECFAYTQIKSIIIPEGVKLLPRRAFAGCKSLEQVTLPSTLKEIGDQAFGDCAKLQEISLPSVQKLSNAVFSGTSLSIIKAPLVEEVGNGCFESCNFTSIELPSVIKLGAEAFRFCTKLKNIEMPNLKSIGNRCFAFCDSMDKFVFPQIEFIGDFNDEPSWTTIVFPSTLTKIGNYCFTCIPKEITCYALKVPSVGDGTLPSYATSKSTLYVPKKVLKEYKSSIGWKNFGNISPLEKEDLCIIKTIDNLKFYLDKELKEATLLPNNYQGDIVVPSYIRDENIEYPVVSFGDSCFYNCRQISSVSIPPTVKTVGSSCFEYCLSLYNITLPEGLINIPKKCFSNTSIKEIRIPSSTTSLGQESFSYCWHLNKIEIPNSVTEIDDACFISCQNLTEITLPTSLKEISLMCFCDCQSLKTISIPSNVNWIKSSAFALCSNLSSITIPASVAYWDETIFEGCNQLTEIKCYATSVPQTFGNKEDIFSGFNSKNNCILYVPEQSIVQYKAFYKDFFKQILPMSTSKIAKTNLDEIKIRQLKDMISVSGISQDCTIKIFNGNGILHNTVKTKNGNACFYAPKGVVILNINNHPYKVLVK